MPGSITATAPLFRSSLEGLAWPALPERAGVWLLAMLAQLDHTQWWSPGELRAHQFRQIEGLLRHAQATVPFYRQRLDAAGFEAGRRLTEELWTRLPILTREEIQAAGAALQSVAVPERHGRVSFHSTSGSTGKPLRIAQTSLANRIYDALTLRDHIWQGRDIQSKLAIIRRNRRGAANYPEGSALADWGPPTSTIMMTGPGCMLDIRAGVEQQIAWLERQRPDYLLTFPTNLEHLARWLRSRGKRLPSLRSVTTFGEVVSSELRELCRGTLGAKIADTYSAVELGCIALQCPDHEHYHVQAEGILVEVLNAEGRACGTGEVGQVVVTPLHNFASPLIRYALGDLAEVGGPCPCGRGLPVLARIAGRTRNLVVLPSGERRWANFGARAFDLPPIIQFQIVQRTIDDIEVRLVSRRPLSATESDGIAETLRKNLGQHFRLCFTYHDAIPRSDSGKYEEFRCEVPL